MAVSGDGFRWFIINASPDLRAQFGSFAALHPVASTARNSPLEAVLLTNADLDHTVGLLSLREGERLHLHASKSVREYLTSTLAFTTILDTFCGTTWHEPPLHDWGSLSLKNGQPSGISYRAITMRSSPPLLQSPGNFGEAETQAFLFKDEQTGGVLLVAPDVFELGADLAQALSIAHAVLFDGTFWSENELGEFKTSAREASAMGHLPVKNGSLDFLSRISARVRIYLHINNTNPMLFPGSPERQAVEDAGMTIGYDGLEFEI